MYTCTIQYIRNIELITRALYFMYRYLYMASYHRTFYVQKFCTSCIKTSYFKSIYENG